LWCDIHLHSDTGGGKSRRGKGESIHTGEDREESDEGCWLWGDIHLHSDAGGGGVGRGEGRKRSHSNQLLRSRTASCHYPGLPHRRPRASVLGLSPRGQVELEDPGPDVRPRPLVHLFGRREPVFVRIPPTWTERQNGTTPLPSRGRGTPRGRLRNFLLTHQGANVGMDHKPFRSQIVQARSSSGTVPLPPHLHGNTPIKVRWRLQLRVIQGFHHR